MPAFDDFAFFVLLLAGGPVRGAVLLLVGVGLALVVGGHWSSLGGVESCNLDVLVGSSSTASMWWGASSSLSESRLVKH